MITVAQITENILLQDDVALAAARKGLLNLSSYARSIQPQIRTALLKDIQEGSIIAALSRLVARLDAAVPEVTDVIQSLAVQSNLEGITYERSAEVASKIRKVYHEINVDNHTFLTVTQGINEITIVAESQVAQVFRGKLEGAHKIYDKANLVGITAKFRVGNLEIPNLIYTLTRRLAYKAVNIIEVVSTATELTYIIDRKDLEVALSQLQKDI
ncbi:MAG TPA: hypothetical protein VFZ58_05560 [Candidatus Saccharimonadales bacterium]